MVCKHTPVAFTFFLNQKGNSQKGKDVGLFSDQVITVIVREKMVFKIGVDFCTFDTTPEIEIILLPLDFQIPFVQNMNIIILYGLLEIMKAN